MSKRKKNIKKKKKENILLTREVILAIGVVWFVFVNIVFLLFFFAFLRQPIARMFNEFASELAYRFPSDRSLDIWSFSVRNDWFRDYLINSRVDPDTINFARNGNYENSLKVMEKVFYSPDTEAEIFIIDYGTDLYDELLYKSSKNNVDEGLVEGQSYVIFGEQGRITHQVLSANLISKKNKKFSILEDKIVEHVYSGIDNRFEGTLSEKEFKNKILNLVSNLQKEDISKEQINIDKISYNKSGANNFEEREGNKINIANVEINFSGCFYYTASDVLYDIQKKLYEFKEKDAVVAKDCISIPVTGGNVEVATCSDCYLFPVDKTHALPSTYTPDVVPLAEFGSGEWLSPLAINDFRELYSAAVAASHSPSITSAYRSYQTQVSTFEYWVQQSLPSVGWDRSQAEVVANRFSARPGFSEHQLGTTLDINSSNCGSFDGYCKDNDNFWLWMRNNAWRYGFVLSYPDGLEYLTGYIYEPWHYRWIGKDLAAEFTGQNLPLNLWLQNR